MYILITCTVKRQILILKFWVHTFQKLPGEDDAVCHRTTLFRARVYPQLSDTTAHQHLLSYRCRGPSHLPDMPQGLWKACCENSSSGISTCLFHQTFSGLRESTQKINPLPLTNTRSSRCRGKHQGTCQFWHGVNWEYSRSPRSHSRVFPSDVLGFSCEAYVKICESWSVYCGPGTEWGTGDGGGAVYLALGNFKRGKISYLFKVWTKYMKKKSNRTPGC